MLALTATRLFSAFVSDEELKLDNDAEAEAFAVSLGSAIVERVWKKRAPAKQIVINATNNCKYLLVKASLGRAVANAGVAKGK